MMNIKNSSCFSLKGLILKGGLLRLPIKYLFPDKIPFKDSSDLDVNHMVFVTGIHRSGTSWIGDVMSCASNLAYWREPYNPSVVGSMPQQYVYLDRNSKNESYKKFTNKILSGKYASSYFDFTKRSNWFGLKSNVHLIKDPTASFLLDWVVNNYNCKAVVVSRHPAGFISSILKLNWDFDFNWFLKQELLMSKYLEPFRELIEKHNYPGMDVRKGAILWCVVYYVLQEISKINDVIWVNYEDICEKPIDGFKTLLSETGLRWNDSVSSKIQESTKSNVTFSSNITTDLNRDTSKMRDIWKARMSTEDVEIIEKYTKQFGLNYYD